MKIIFDSNVILSALITQGLSYRVFDICIDKHQLFISSWIINEILTILDTKMHTPKAEIERVKVFFDTIFNKINPEGNLPNICRDIDDNNILLLARSIMADLIITGHNDLLSLNNHLNTKIISPRQYIENYYKPD
jgi:putative PIN family toxin of toxin-antitoxin system